LSTFDEMPRLSTRKAFSGIGKLAGKSPQIRFIAALVATSGLFLAVENVVVFAAVDRWIDPKK